MPRVEMMLYHGNARTGTIQISTTSDAGPWTDLTLTSTQCVSDAMDEWTSLANAALPARSWLFECYDNDSQMQLNLGSSGGDAWVLLPTCLATLFDLVDTAIDIGDGDITSVPLLSAIYIGTGPVHGNALAVGLDFPTDVEDAELSEYRAARASALHYGRAQEVTVDLIIASDLWAAAEDSPIFGGHAAFKVVHDNETAFDEDNLDGFLVVYPVEELERERESDDGPCWLRFRCTTEDP